MPDGRCGGERGHPPGRARCPSAAAARGSRPLAVPGMGGLCPEAREPPRQKGETALFPGADDSAFPEASSFSFSSLGFIAPPLFRWPSPPSHPKRSRGSRGAAPAVPALPHARRCPLDGAGRQRGRAVPSQGAAKVHRPIY